MTMNTQRIILAGGCFWCLEAVFRQLRGVLRAVSGYTGGTTLQPTYREVCNGSTGHAEAVDITFDPAVISLEDLLAVFFTSHDPTTLNRQGHDVGTQYRSAVFTHDPDQAAQVRRVIAAVDASGLWQGPVVTTVQSAVTFYPAEDYHQEYYLKNPGQPYCQAVVKEKVDKVRALFPGLLSAG